MVFFFILIDTIWNNIVIEPIMKGSLHSEPLQDMSSFFSYLFAYLLFSHIIIHYRITYLLCTEAPKSHEHCFISFSTLWSREAKADARIVMIQLDEHEHGYQWTGFTLAQLLSNVLMLSRVFIVTRECPGNTVRTS